MDREAETEKLYAFLGLCARARALTSGQTSVLQQIRAGKALLVIVARDASANTRDLYLDKCASNHVTCVPFGESERLGAAVGKNKRSALAITDAHFAEEIEKRLSLLQPEL